MPISLRSLTNSPIGVAGLITLFVLVAWLATLLLFSSWTSSGSAYESLEQYDYSGPEREIIRIYDRSEMVMAKWTAETDVLELDVFTSGIVTLTINVGPTDAVEALNFECEGPGVGGKAISWRFSHTVYDRLRPRYGQNVIQGCMKAFSFSESHFLTGSARNINIELPSGGLEPLLTKIVDLGIQGTKQGVEPKNKTALIQRLASRLDDQLGYQRNESTISRMAYLYGHIQFITILTALFTLGLMLLAWGHTWARSAAESALNLIPYIGFFGTLLGMGTALHILGDANLSDATSKAISLGPIGSKLGLAIETTKLALFCFAIVSFIGLVNDALRHKRSPSDT